MNIDRPIIIACAALCALGAYAAPAGDSQKVRDIITRVNNRWQATHSPEHNAFWDNAAYHTGNMEAYFLTGNEDWKDYSEQWAAYNGWKGATSDNKAGWKYATYGEDNDHVMFGDWQIC